MITNALLELTVSWVNLILSQLKYTSKSVEIVKGSWLVWKLLVWILWQETSQYLIYCTVAWKNSTLAVLICDQTYTLTVIASVNFKPLCSMLSEMFIYLFWTSIHQSPRTVNGLCCHHLQYNHASFFIGKAMLCSHSEYCWAWGVSLWLEAIALQACALCKVHWRENIDFFWRLASLKHHQNSQYFVSKVDIKVHYHCGSNGLKYTSV